MKLDTNLYMGHYTFYPTTRITLHTEGRPHNDRRRSSLLWVGVHVFLVAFIAVNIKFSHTPDLKKALQTVFFSCS